ncbi:11520_t:CDS:2 [Entrophospora sp. SA101]|nr:11520_t:CDS:2 [Entrophospora sp. SA101]
MVQPSQIFTYLKVFENVTVTDIRIRIEYHFHKITNIRIWS